MNGILMKNTKKKRCNKFSILMQSMNLVLQYKKKLLDFISGSKYDFGYFTLFDFIYITEIIEYDWIEN